MALQLTLPNNKWGITSQNAYVRLVPQRILQDQVQVEVEIEVWINEAARRSGTCQPLPGIRFAQDGRQLLRFSRTITEPDIVRDAYTKLKPVIFPAAVDV